MKQEPVHLLSLKDLSHRFTFLSGLLNGERCQTIFKLSLNNDEKKKLISCIRPHKAVSHDTISQWIKNL